MPDGVLESNDRDFPGHPTTLTASRFGHRPETVGLPVELLWCATSSIFDVSLLGLAILRARFVTIAL
jgi:hypothetical protein